MRFRLLLGTLSVPFLVMTQAWAANPSHPQPAEKLSDWVLRVHGPTADTTALHWYSRAETQLQGQLQQKIAEALENQAHIALPAVQKQALADWFRALPVTGRLTLVQQAPRALQAWPYQDPVFNDGDHFHLYDRPQTVAVVNESGQPCFVRHAPGARVSQYLQACAAALPTVLSADHAWIAQPDGRTQPLGVAPWSLTPQPEPAPGAWLWAPSRNAGIQAALSDNIIRFLATQAPPDQHPRLSRGHLTVHSVQPTALSLPEPQGPVHTSNDWGELGYWQTPSARMGAAGTVRAHVSRVSPYTRLTTVLQPLEGFEVGFRYTSVSNRLYGPNIAGSQSYKDKSIDIKLRLRPEDAWGPEVALGLRDIGGTGLFSSEYLVASKRWGDWDASLGLGWGNLGSRANIKNPLSWLGSGYATRPARDVGQGGTTNFNSLFRGPTSLFAGLQWAPAGSPWVVKAELDGNNYQAEPQANNQPVASPLNLGLVYRPSASTAWSLAWERGNRVMLGFTLQGNLGQLYVPKTLDPAGPKFSPSMPAALPARGWADVAQEIERHTGWQVVSVNHQHGRATVSAQVDGALYLQQRIDRVTGLLHALAPSGIGQFQLQLSQRGLPLTQVDIDRAEWVLQHSTALPTASALPVQADYALESARPPAQAQWSQSPPAWQFSWSPTYDQILGGPDGFLLYQLGVAANAQWNLSPQTWVNGIVKLGLADNFDKFDYTAPSNLPRVRTFAREFTTASRVTIPRLQLTHVQHLGGSHYASAYAGMLEPMYGGVGAEWLYRPFKSPWALGVDVNHVRQRAFEQNLSFRDYRVNTGHATLHWDTGWNDVHLKLQLGRYLAGDVGATLDLKRTFDNGVAIGAWATKTNVSAAQFGEGSFDKGLYVSIPFDAMLPLSSPAVANLAWTPLTRDGGARLNRSVSLFDLTQARSPRALRWRSAQPAPNRSAESTAYVLQDAAPHPLHSLGATTGNLWHQMGDVPGSTWLWAGGAVLASSLLDKKADRWAINHQNGGWNTAGSIGNAVPYLFVAGAGMLATGVAGDSAATTAGTALRAGAYTLAASFATRGVLGRSRPQAGLGAGDFAGPSTASLQSSFVSNHTALAFALATPFAQQHNMPWLYGLAAASAVGRVQKREHWLSDTVGGALLGYGMGSLLSLQQSHSGKGPRVFVTPESIQAHWTY